MSLLNSTGTRRDGNGTIFTPPGPPSNAPLPTGLPVKIHDGSGVPKDGWINGGLVVTEKK